MNEQALFTVMTDTCADIPWQTAQQQQIEIAHLHYQMDQAAYAYDLGRRTDLAAFYYAMRAGAWVQTIPVLPEAFLSLWEPVLAAGRDVLQITVAQSLSNTLFAAMTARQTILARYPKRRVVVVDSGCCAVAQGMLAYEAAQMRLEGKSLDEAAEWIVCNRRHVNGLLLPADAKWLRQGGLTGGGGLGDLLGRRPVLRLDDVGLLETIGHAKSAADGIAQIAAAVGKAGYALKDQVLSVTHADDPELASQLCDALREHAGCTDIMVLPMGPVIGCYAGPGAVGVAFFGASR